MDKKLMRKMVQLIIERSPASVEESLDVMKAIRVDSPMAERRYERLLPSALNDEAAGWAADERKLLTSIWTEKETAEPGKPKMRALKLTDEDWAKAKTIGGGDATAGIRAALREYPKPN